MAHVYLFEDNEIDDRCRLLLIPKKANGQRDWSVSSYGNDFIEFREKGKRRRSPGGAKSPMRSKSNGESMSNLKPSCLPSSAPQTSHGGAAKTHTTGHWADRHRDPDQIESLRS